MKKIPDGQHRHGESRINLSDEGLKLIADHLPDCPNLPPVLNKSSQVPMQFIIEESGATSIACGYCQKNLGKCKFSHEEVGIRARRRK